MGPHNLSDEDEALIKHFRQSAEAVGFDGLFSLAPDERGVVSVAVLVKTRTILQILLALGLRGSAAWDVATRAREIPVPLDEEAAQLQLYNLYRSK